MSGPEKDAAVERFRVDVPLLLCTESGGEGRNLQFCNTLVNFDLPWNPMTIEQRIGRCTASDRDATCLSSTSPCVAHSKRTPSPR